MQGCPSSRKDIESLLHTDWYGVYLKEKKVGYFCLARDRVGSTIRESGTFSMKLAASKMKTEFFSKQTMTFEDSPPYRLLHAEHEQRFEPTPPETASLVRTAKGLDFTYRTGQEVSKKILASVDYNLADALALDLWFRHDPQVGDAMDSKEFEVKEIKNRLRKSKIVGVKSSLAGGVNVRYFEVENEDRELMVNYLTRHDDQGRTLSSVIAAFEIRLETEEQAKNTEYSQDLFVLGMARSDRALGLTKKVTELVLQVDGLAGEIFEDGPRQQVAAGPAGSRLLKLGKKYGKAAPATERERASGLEETLTYPISHPRVQALAAKAVGEAQLPEEKVRRIVQFVNGFVNPTPRVSIPTIHDLLDKKTGDCKSYALLVTTLARAAGVPAREVSGLLYAGDDQKAFAGHAWNEVVLGGNWVPVDASLRKTEIDATHICFGTEQKAAKNLLTTLGKLNFKVVEVKSMP